MVFNDEKKKKQQKKKKKATQNRDNTKRKKDKWVSLKVEDRSYSGKSTLKS